MAATTSSNPKPKKGQKPATGGIVKDRPHKEKKDAKTLLEEAKAQNKEIQEQDLDAMATDKRERDKAKEDKLSDSLFVQENDQPQETVSPMLRSMGSSLTLAGSRIEHGKWHRCIRLWDAAQRHKSTSWLRCS